MIPRICRLEFFEFFANSQVCATVVPSLTRRIYFIFFVFCCCAKQQPWQRVPLSEVKPSLSNSLVCLAILRFMFERFCVSNLVLCATSTCCSSSDFNAKEGAQTFEWEGEGEPRERSDLREEGCTDFLYSTDGSFIGYLSKDKIVVKSSVDGAIICSLSVSKVNVFAFSPRASFIQTFANFSSTDEELKAGNHLVWSVATGEVVKRVIHKAYSKENWPPIQWTADESFAAQLVANEVQIFAGNDVGGKALKRIHLEGVRQFSWSPNPKQHRICLFVPEKKGVPGSATIYQYPDVERKIAHQCFFNAQDVSFSWNVYATALLITTHTDYDSTGKSYYGKSALYLLSEATSCLVPLNDQVYSSSWKPNGRHFVATYGYPQRTTMFNLSCRPTADFGEAPRNTSLWQPHSQLLGLAGFGSLQGDIDIWDPTELKKVGRCNVHGSKYCAWAPNGRAFLSAVISTGLKVDNGFKIWAYDGKLLYKKDVGQLDGISWRPAVWGSYPAPKLDLVYKTDSELAATQPSVAYRHPNAAQSSSSFAHRATSGPTKYTPPAKRSTVPGDALSTSSSTSSSSASSSPSSSSRGGRGQSTGGGIPGDTTPLPAATARRGRGSAASVGSIPGDTGPGSSAGRGSTRSRGAATRGAAATSVSSSPSGRGGRGQATTPTSEEDDPVENLQRKKRALTKKLRQIDALKAQAASGKVLLPAQVSKIGSEEDIRKQIAEVDAEIAAF